MIRKIAYNCDKCYIRPEQNKANQDDEHILRNVIYTESRFPYVTVQKTFDNLRHFMPQRWICCKHQEVCAAVKVNEIPYDQVRGFPYSPPVWYPRQNQYNCNGHEQQRDSVCRVMST